MMENILNGGALNPRYGSVQSIYPGFKYERESAFYDIEDVRDRVREGIRKADPNGRINSTDLQQIVSPQETVVRPDRIMYSFERDNMFGQVSDYLEDRPRIEGTDDTQNPFNKEQTDQGRELLHLFLNLSLQETEYNDDSPSLLSKDIEVYCNLPQDQKNLFVSEVFTPELIAGIKERLKSGNNPFDNEGKVNWDLVIDGVYEKYKIALGEFKMHELNNNSVQQQAIDAGIIKRPALISPLKEENEKVKRIANTLSMGFLENPMAKAMGVQYDTRDFGKFFFEFLSENLKKFKRQVGSANALDITYNPERFIDDPLAYLMFCTVENSSEVRSRLKMVKNQFDESYMGKDESGNNSENKDRYRIMVVAGGSFKAITDVIKEKGLDPNGVDIHLVDYDDGVLERSVSIIDELKSELGIPVDSNELRLFTYQSNVFKDDLIEAQPRIIPDSDNSIVAIHSRGKGFNFIEQTGIGDYGNKNQKSKLLASAAKLLDKKNGRMTFTNVAGNPEANALHLGGTAWLHMYYENVGDMRSITEKAGLSVEPPAYRIFATQKGLYNMVVINQGKMMQGKIEGITPLAEDQKIAA